MPQKSRFIIGIILQVLLLVGIIVYAITIMTSGQTIILKVTPSYLNKRLVKAGEYVILDYDINLITLDDNIETDFDYAESNLKLGDKVYIELKSDEKLGYWVPVGVKINQPHYDREAQGDKANEYVQGQFLTISETDGIYKITLNYDFKDYFLPLNKHTDVDLAKVKDMRVKLLIKPSHEIKMLQLIVDGTEI